VNNLTISVVTYQWDGQQVRGLAKDLAGCREAGIQLVLNKNDKNIKKLNFQLLNYISHTLFVLHNFS